MHLLLAAAALLSGCGGKAEIATAPEPVAPGYCAKACSVTADCCPLGVPSCPGEYPLNYSCEEGLCRAPHCENDADCSLTLGDSGVVNLVCRSVGGHVGCLRGCSADSDCAPLGGLSGGTCTGKADDGTSLCAVPPGTLTLGCKTDSDCPAQRHCQSGVCGCSNDDECAPGLDVCTTNRDFRYPPSAAPAPGGG